MFFFKQKTAYELRISDWSSDVCSSDLSLLYLAGLGSAAAFASASLATNGLLALSGVITSVPLLLFAMAAKRLRYSTLGLLQYIAPTLQFLIGVLVFKETLSDGQMASFALIWVGLILYTAGSLRPARAERRGLPGIECRGGKRGRKRRE